VASLRLLLQHSAFDPASPQHGRFHNQFNGNHFTLGISLPGFEGALMTTAWSDYTRDPSHFLDSNGKCWNKGLFNGYDLCIHIKTFMRKIGKPHLSLVEAIMCGEAKASLFACNQRLASQMPSFHTCKQCHWSTPQNPCTTQRQDMSLISSSTPSSLLTTAAFGSV
jgi:hypothetical protein